MDIHSIELKAEQKSSRERLEQILSGNDALTSSLFTLYLSPGFSGSTKDKIKNPDRNRAENIEGKSK